MTHPITAVVTPEELREIRRQVQYCEITWPQCCEFGEPIRLRSEDVQATTPEAFK